MSDQYFRGAKDFVVNAPVFSNVMYNTETFMEKLEKYTIPGVEFDSSARDYPPRCHPGTRLSLIQRVHGIIDDQRRGRRLLWLVGPAGVGKSAIMQALAENVSSGAPNVSLGASLFFTVNGCEDDASRVFVTLAYQIAVAHPPYRDVVRREMMKDPKLPLKSMKAQFRKFIIEPFVEEKYLGLNQPLLILIDGLDECKSRDHQSEIIRLISSFSVTHPEAPLIWVIASRPEPHLTATFSQPSVASTYFEIEVVIDSDEACADTERYLRDELERIRLKYPALALFTRWPSKRDFLKIAATAGGLFAYPSTVVKFIDDPTFGDPEAQLRLVIDVIDNMPVQPTGGRTHPMANLDALYARIFSRIPSAVMPNTKLLLLAALNRSHTGEPLANVGDWLRMTPNVVYAALHQLYSVLEIPLSEAAEKHPLRFYHKSLSDYLLDEDRSRIFPGLAREIDDFDFMCILRLFKSLPVVASNPSLDHTQVILWPRRRSHYVSLQVLYNRLRCHALPILLQKRPLPMIPDVFHALRVMSIGHWVKGNLTDFYNLLFTEPHRSGLLRHHVLREIPIKTLDPSNISRKYDILILYRFKFSSDAISTQQRSCTSIEHVVYGPFERDGYHEWERLISPEVVRLDLEPPERATIDRACECTQDAFLDFQLARSRSSDYPAIAYIGSNDEHFGFVYYEVVDPMNESFQRIYMIPYRFSSATGT